MIKTKKNLSVFVAFSAILLLTFLLPIVKYKLCYILPLDNFDQNYLLMKGLRNQLSTFSLNSYEWSMVFGAASNCYTYIMSNLAWLAIFISENYLKYFSFILTLIRICLIFVTSWIWTSKLTQNTHSRLLSSLLFSFCGYVFFYISFSTWIEMMIFFPLIFYFIEKYLQENKFFGLVLAVALLGCCNYYYCYMSVPVSCLYALIRYIKINENSLQFKSIIIKAFKFIGFYLLGIGISAFVLIPCAYIFADLGRFSSSTSPSLFDHLSLSGIYGLVTSLYTPVFESMSFNPFIHGGIQCTLFSFMLGAFIIPMSFQLKNKSSRYTMIGIFAILGLALFFTYFWYLFERVIDGRWFFYFTLFVVYALILVIDEYESGLYKKREIVIAFFINVIMIISIYLIGLKFNVVETLFENFKILLPYYLCLIAYFVYFILSCKKFLILLLIFSVEIIYSGFIYAINNTPLPVEFFEHENDLNSIVSKILSSDTAFYRIQLDSKTMPEFFNTYNIPYAYGFRGLSGYSSTYEGEMRDYLNRIDGSMWMFNQLFGRVDMYNLLSTKYFICYESDVNVPSGYQFLFEENDYMIYENTNFLELGYATDKVISKEYLDKSAYLFQDQLLSNYLSLENNQIMNKPNELQNLKYVGTLSPDTYRELWFEKPLNNGTVYIDNRGIPELTVSFCGDNGCKTRSPIYQFDYQDYRVTSEDQINYMIIEGEDIYDTGLYMEVYYKADTDLEEERNNKNTFYNTSLKADKVYGKLDILGEENYVFTSIPFNRGWKVIANGQKVDTFKVNNGFLGFKLSKGNYEIEFSFKERGKSTGVLISLVSIILLLFLCFNSKIKKKKI